MSYDPRDFDPTANCDECDGRYHYDNMVSHNSGFICTDCLETCDHLIHATLCGHVIDTRKSLVFHDGDGETSCLSCAREHEPSMAA